MENNQFNIFDEIARTVNDNTHKTITKSLFGVGLTLGTFNGDSLTLDNFNKPITDFLILDILNLSESYSTEQSDNHAHRINTPEPLKGITSGDRVLVAEIGSECVIIGRVSHG